MTNHTIIRRANVEDALQLSELIEDVSRRFCFTSAQEVPAWFLATITPDAIAGTIDNPSFCYFVALLNGELVGVIAVRDATHVHHLFVSQKVQRRGIAQLLWLNAKEQALTAGNITVRSSLFAVPIYERFGFVISGPSAEKEGLSYQPMELRLGKQVVEDAPFGCWDRQKRIAFTGP